MNNIDIAAALVHNQNQNLNDLNEREKWLNLMLLVKKNL